MGVLIEGLDMPSNCSECPLSDHDWNNKTYCKLKNRKDSLENGYAREHKRDDCPLIEIPTPHGRLIDGDEVMKQLQADKREAFTKHDVWLMLSKYGAPTILEAEE